MWCPKKIGHKRRLALKSVNFLLKTKMLNYGAILLKSESFNCSLVHD